MSKIWMDDMYERQGLFGTTAVEAEYELLTMNEDVPTESLAHLRDETDTRKPMASGREENIRLLLQLARLNLEQVERLVETRTKADTQ